MTDVSLTATPYLAYSANVHQRAGRIVMTFSHADEHGRLTVQAFDIDPFSLQLAALLLQVMNDQAADRDDGPEFPDFGDDD